MALLSSISGFLQHRKRLKRLSSPQAQREVAQALYVAGQLIEIDAEISITTGSISGKNHVPSAPGQPPNADTRLLDSSINTYVDSISPPKVTVESAAPYSAALEFGTSRMQARPFMRPATTKNKQKAVKIVEKAVERIVTRK